MKRFVGKRALITGGGSGIGKAIAQRLAKEGGDVFIVERNRGQGESVVAAITELGGTAKLLLGDVSSMESMASAIEEIGVLDILVNNAGISSIGNIENTDSEEMDRVYAINVKGVFHCMHLAVARMKERGSGVILNMASIASKLGIADRFAYSMSKGAVLSMTMSVARDYTKNGHKLHISS